MDIKKGHKIIAGVIAVFAFIIYTEYSAEKEQKSTTVAQSINTEEQTAYKNAYDNLQKKRVGDFSYMYNSVFEHRDHTNNISIYIKYNHNISKAFLFLKITGATWATRVHTIRLVCDGETMPIEYINDVYPFEASAANKKMYGKLEMQIGGMLTDFLKKMSQGHEVYVYFSGDGVYDKFPVSDKEKQALQEVILAFHNLKR